MGPNRGRELKLWLVSGREGGGIPMGAGKRVDMRRKHRGEGGLLDMK